MSYNYDEVAKRLNDVCSAHDLAGFYNMVAPWMESIKTLKNNLTYNEVNLNKTSLSLEEMKNIALKFYGELGFKFKEKIEKVLNDKDTIMRSSEPTNEGGNSSVGVHTRTDNLVCTDIIVIDLHPKNDMTGVVTVAHEFGHILSERNQKKMKPNTDCVGEIETMFFEQIFIDWLYDKGKITEEDYNNLLQARDNSLFNDIQQLIDEDHIIKKLGTPISAKKLQIWDDELTKNGDLGERGHFIRAIESMITDPDSMGEYKFRYVFGEIVARAMYKDYQIEPNEALKNLNTFLIHSAEYNFGMRKTWQSDKCKEASQLNNDEIKKCLTTLLGANYKEKIDEIINNLNSETKIEP